MVRLKPDTTKRNRLQRLPASVVTLSVAACTAAVVIVAAAVKPFAGTVVNPDVAGEVAGAR